MNRSYWLGSPAVLLQSFKCVHQCYPTDCFYTAIILIATITSWIYLLLLFTFDSIIHKFCVISDIEHLVTVLFCNL